MIKDLLEELSNSRVVKTDVEYHLVRGAMGLTFILFGYQNWAEQAGSRLLGLAECVFGLLLLAGFWSKRAGMLGALGACVVTLAMVMSIPFVPNGWDQTAGGFPAMSGEVTVLMKYVVFAAASFYLLSEDLNRTVQADKTAGRGGLAVRALARAPWLAQLFQKANEYRLLRGAMLIIFLFFGYTKWHLYAAQVMVPFISHSPFIFWLYPVFGFRGATRFLGASEWTIAALLYAGFWDKRLGALGAAGATFTFLTTVTIIPFMPDGWNSAGGLPAMNGEVSFLAEDLVLLSVSIYLLKQDLVRLLDSARGRPAMAMKATAAT